MALGLGLFAFALIVALAMGWAAVINSRKFDESKHVNLIQTQLGKGK